MTFSGLKNLPKIIQRDDKKSWQTKYNLTERLPILTTHNSHPNGARNEHQSKSFLNHNSSTAGRQLLTGGK